MKKNLLTLGLLVSLAGNAQISLGTESTETGTFPVNSNYGYTYTQQIFTKQEINANAAGNITGLKFYLSPDADISMSNQWVVSVGNSSQTSFVDYDDYVAPSTLTQVFSGTVTNVNGVVEVTFTTPFNYDNVGSLIIAVDENLDGYNSYDDSFTSYDSGIENTSLAFVDDYNNIDPTNLDSYGYVSSYKSAITFLGLTPSVFPNCPLIISPEADDNRVGLTPTLEWNTVSGAISYKVSLGTTSGGTDILNQVSSTTNTYSITTPLQYNTTYYLKVVGVSAGGESQGCGEISFTTNVAPPANDLCSNAATIVVGIDYATGEITSNNAGADSDQVFECSSSANAVVWYKATIPPSGNLTIETKTNGDESMDDTLLNVYEGTCGNLTSLACNDDGGDEAFSLLTITGRTPGEVVYIAAAGYGSDQGSFKLSTYDVSSLSAPEFSELEGIKLYPNPFTTSVSIANYEKVATAQIIDITGKVIKTVNKPESKIETSDLATGTYLIKLNLINGSSKTIKAIKK